MGETACLFTKKISKSHKRRECRRCKMVYARAWRQTPKGKISGRKWYQTITDTKMYQAKIEVFKAVRSGTLKRASTLKCVDCGVRAQCYDHRNYRKPLDVEPVCRSCNSLRGRGANWK